MRRVEPYATRAEKRRRLLDAALAEFVALCAEKQNVCGVYVFGSYALERVGPHSDLDVLVVRDTHLPRLSRGDDLLLQRSSSVPLDLIVLTPQEFTSELSRSSFGTTILETMRQVYAT